MATTSTSRGSSWSDNEVRALSIWEEENTQEKLDRAVRNQVIFNDIATKMREKGRQRLEQCRTQIKNLKKIPTDKGSQWENWKREESIQILYRTWVISQHQCQQFYWTLGPPALVVVPQKTLKNPVIVLKEEKRLKQMVIKYYT